MDLKKTVLNTSLVLAMGGASMSANAALLGSTTAVLDFTGVNTWSGPPPVVPVNTSSGLDGGIRIGVTQPLGGHPAHIGPAHPNTGRLDQEWTFLGNAGQSFTTSPVVVVNDNGTNKTLDFSGWRVSWSQNPSIDMGGGLQDCGTTTDGICVGNSGEDIAGTYDNGTSLASITCSTSSCSSSSTFTLSYQAIIPQADPSGLAGLQYDINITGVVNSVPVPAAVWLFGSGLLGLAGIARRKKTA